MRDRGIDADDEVELRDDGRRVGEVLELRSEMDDLGMRGHQRRVVLAQLGMQTDIADARIAKQGCEPLEADRAPAVGHEVAHPC